jgi:hypothetical protein
MYIFGVYLRVFGDVCEFACSFSLIPKQSHSAKTPNFPRTCGAGFFFREKGVTSGAPRECPIEYCVVFCSILCVFLCAKECSGVLWSVIFERKRPTFWGPAAQGLFLEKGAPSVGGRTSWWSFDVFVEFLSVLVCFGARLVFLFFPVRVESVVECVLYVLHRLLFITCIKRGSKRVFTFSRWLKQNL